MDMEDDPLKKLWFNPLFVRIRKNPWFLSAIFMICVHFLGVYVVFPLIPYLGALFPIIKIGAFITAMLIVIRHTVFRNR